MRSYSNLDVTVYLLEYLYCCHTCRYRDVSLKRSAELEMVGAIKGAGATKVDYRGLEPGNGVAALRTSCSELEGGGGMEGEFHLSFNTTAQVSVDVRLVPLFWSMYVMRGRTLENPRETPSMTGSKEASSMRTVPTNCGMFSFTRA